MAQLLAVPSAVSLLKSDGFTKSYNGSTDLARGVALTAAVAAAVAGDKILLSPGTFQVAATLNLPAGSTLIGSGYGTVLKYAGYAITCTDADNCRIESMKIEGGVDLNGCDYTRLDKVDIDATGVNYGVYAHNGTRATWLTNCKVLNAVSHGCWFTEYDGNRDLVECCEIRDNGGDGLRWDIGGGVVGSGWMDANSTVVCGNLIGGNTSHGIYASAQHDISINNNDIEGNLQGAIYIHMPIETSIVGNVMEYNFTGTGTQYEITLEVEDSNVVYGDATHLRNSANICNNTIQGYERGILIDHPTADLAIIAQINIRGNLFQAGSGDSLYCHTMRPTTKLIIEGNDFENTGLDLMRAVSGETMKYSRIANNRFFDQNYYGVYAYGGIDWMICDNLFMGSNTGYTTAMGVWLSGDGYVLRNRFGNLDKGVRCQSNISVLEGNIFESTCTTKVELVSVTSCTARNNIGWGRQFAPPRFVGAVDVDWNDSNRQTIVLANGANTLTFANPVSGSTYVLELKQPASGAAGTVTWPAAVKWPAGVVPTLTATNGQTDIVALYYNGTNYAGTYALNYAL